MFILATKRWHPRAPDRHPVHLHRWRLFSAIFGKRHPHPFSLIFIGTRPAPAGTRSAHFWHPLARGRHPLAPDRRLAKTCYWHPLAPGRHPVKAVRDACVFLYFMTMQYSAPAGIRPAPDEYCAECICFCILHGIARFGTRRHPAGTR